LVFYYFLFCLAISSPSNQLETIKKTKKRKTKHKQQKPLTKINYMPNKPRTTKEEDTSPSPHQKNKKNAKRNINNKNPSPK